MTLYDIFTNLYIFWYCVMSDCVIVSMLTLNEARSDSNIKHKGLNRVNLKLYIS